MSLEQVAVMINKASAFVPTNAEELAERDEQMFTHEVDGQTVGYVSYGKIDQHNYSNVGLDSVPDNSIYIRTLVVHEDYRNECIGSELVGRVLDEALDLGADVYALGTRTNNIHSKWEGEGIAKRLGFQKIVEKEDYFAGVPCVWCGDSCSCLTEIWKNEY